jgi:hypothetical protein
MGVEGIRVGPQGRSQHPKGQVLEDEKGAIPQPNAVNGAAHGAANGAVNGAAHGAVLTGASAAELEAKFHEQFERLEQHVNKQLEGTEGRLKEENDRRFSAVEAAIKEQQQEVAAKLDALMQALQPKMS